MNEVEVGIEYLSVGANRHTAVADWNEDGLVAFGADSNIALWEPNNASVNGVSHLLAGHSDTVKAVKFLPKPSSDSESYLVSGGDDQTLKIWKCAATGSATCVQSVKEHTGAINCIATVHARQKPVGPTIFATGAADASIKIWAFENGEAKLLQTIKTSPKFFPLCVALSHLNEAGDGLVLAVAGTKTFVQIFVASSSAEPNFEAQTTLSGHEGWVRSLDFAFENSATSKDLVLASASQDKYVRLWRFHQGQELPPATAGANDPTMGLSLPGTPSNKAHRLKVGDLDFSITFEALLLGHDDWIYSAKWFSNPASGKLQLLSTSADNTLSVWEADPSSGIWVTTVRLGEISREKGATTATGSTGGFWTGLWSPDGSSVICLGRTGSWRRWYHNKERDQWMPEIGISGHTRSVTGIAWSKNGDYLLSTSSDQTTRLHARWNAGERKTWHEMARPQIHGYDLNCIDSIGSSQFVSGADEKLMRVFNEPKAVAKLLNHLCDIGATSQIEDLPDAANMPVLGLSNKAIEAVDDDMEIETANPDQDREALDPGSTVRKSVLEIDHPPLEDSLARHTLWPEVEKLYGHGYELSCLAVSHDGKLVASACKASSLNHAVIRVFETERWTEVRPPLAAHTLTVTRLRFSPDDKYLLSVGRDRQWAVFERDSEDPTMYKSFQNNPKGHTRMILDAAWAPLADDALVFATAGRDKSIKIWKKSADAGIACITTIPATHPVTAVDFLPRLTEEGTLVLAAGSEIGKVSIHIINATDLSVISSAPLSPEFCLAKAVLQLSWRPHATEKTLAIAGEDASLRIYSYSGPST